MKDFPILIILFIFLAVESCIEKDDSIACQTDQECITRIWGKWEKTYVFASRLPDCLQFTQDSLWIEYYGNDCWKEPEYTDTSLFYIIGDTLMRQIKHNYYDTVYYEDIPYEIQTLNLTRLVIDDSYRYKRVY